MRGTVSLSAPAPVGGAVVNLTNSNLSLASTPAILTILRGATTGFFNVGVGNIPPQTSVTIWAFYLGLASRRPYIFITTIFVQASQQGTIVRSPRLQHN